MNTAARALHVYGSLNRGGAETWLMDVMRNTGRDRLAIDVCLTKDDKGPYEDEFQELGGRIHRCHLDSGPFQFAQKFTDLLNNENYDIVHSHLYYFSGIVLRCAAKAHVRERVAHIHPVIDVKHKSIPRRLYTYLMRRWICKYGTRYVGPTKGSLEGFWGSGWNSDPRKSVLYNGLKVERFADDVDRASVRQQLEIPETGKIVLNVGRYAPHKRQDFLVDVAREVCEQREDVFFVLIGNGDLREPVMAKAEAQGVAGKCRFIPGAPSIDEFYLSADAFAFPSSNEGFGIAVAEAGAAGLPTVAQDIPGVEEAADSCHDITLLPLDTRADSWATHLVKKLEKSPLSQEDRRRHLADFPFSIEASIRSLMQLYGLECDLD